MQTCYRVLMPLFLCLSVSLVCVERVKTLIFVQRVFQSCLQLVGPGYHWVLSKVPAQPHMMS